MAESDHIIVQAPMSFTGATLRINRIMEADNLAVKWLIAFPIVCVLLPLAWISVFCWYLIFGIFLIPYRLIRRSQRKQKQAALRQRELIEAQQNAKR